MGFTTPQTSMISKTAERIGFEDLITDPEPYDVTIQPLRKKSIIKPAMAAMALTALIGGGYISWPYLTPSPAEPVITAATQKKTDLDIARARSRSRNPVRRPRGCSGPGGGHNLWPPDQIRWLATIIL